MRTCYPILGFLGSETSPDSRIEGSDVIFSYDDLTLEYPKKFKYDITNQQIITLVS